MLSLIHRTRPTQLHYLETMPKNLTTQTREVRKWEARIDKQDWSSYTLRQKFLWLDRIIHKEIILKKSYKRILLLA